jgi:hypothetical protein
VPILKLSDIKDNIEQMQRYNKMLILVEEPNLSELASYVEKNKLSEKVKFMVFGDLK